MAQINSNIQLPMKFKMNLNYLHMKQSVSLMRMNLLFLQTISSQTVLFHEELLRNVLFMF